MVRYHHISEVLVYITYIGYILYIFISYIYLYICSTLGFASYSVSKPQATQAIFPLLFFLKYLFPVKFGSCLLWPFSQKPIITTLYFVIPWLPLTVFFPVITHSLNFKTSHVI